MIFDWSTRAEAGTSDVTSIKWAAFYSDCEHEVLEVTAGHRVTLTYNLYTTRATGHLAGHANILSLAEHPVYQTLKAAMMTPGFMTDGGF